MIIDSKESALEYVRDWKAHTSNNEARFAYTIQSQRRIVSIMRSYSTKYAPETIQGHLDAIEVLESAHRE